MNTSSFRSWNFAVVAVSPEGLTSMDKGVYENIEGMFPNEVTAKFRETRLHPTTGAGYGRFTFDGWMYNWIAKAI